MRKRIDLSKVKAVTGSRYPAPFDAPCAARIRQRLGDEAELTDFGVNLLRLPAGDCAGFKAGVKNGHHVQNRSQRDAVVLEIGSPGYRPALRKKPRGIRPQGWHALPQALV
jgi:uncharacterized cupin superfamily protein